MSVQAFDGRSGLVFVQVEISGPRGSTVLKLGLDTGATRSLIQPTPLHTVGIDLLDATQHASMTTGSAIEMVPLVVLTRL